MNNRYLLTVIITTLLVLDSVGRPFTTDWLLIDSSNSNLPSNAINAITEDNEGNIWIATNNGFAKYLGNYQWMVFHNPNALGADVCLSIVAQDSVIWAATVNSLVRYCNNQLQVFDPANSPLAAYFIYSLAVENSILWIGTADYGLYMYDGTNFTNFNPSNTGNMPLENIWSVAVDDVGSKWISCRSATNPSASGAIVKFDNVSWTKYDSSNSNLQAHPNKISISNNGNKWITSVYETLVKYDDTIWSVYDSASSGRQLNCYSEVAFDHLDQKWLTINGGFCKYDDVTWQFYDSSNVAFDHAIGTSKVIFVDRGYNKWIGTNEGIMVFNETGITIGIKPAPSSSKEVVKIVAYENHLYLEFHTPPQSASLHIYNYAGMINLSLNLTENGSDLYFFELNTESLVAGLYYCVLLLDDNIIARPFITN